MKVSFVGSFRHSVEVEVGEGRRSGGSRSGVVRFEGLGRLSPAGMTVAE